MIIPARLQAGDCIGIFSPAGPVRDQAKVDGGILRLQNMGFRVKQFQPSETGNGYLAADDNCRLDEFHTLLGDKDVHALMALRGGYGCLRIADRIDYEQVHASGKFIMGFSDITILLNAVNSRAGLAAIHGPVLTTLATSDQSSVDALFSLLTSGLPTRIGTDEAVILRSGDAQGVLRGGNLTTLVHLLGTPWDISWTGSLLLLEDTGEPMYKIDRMLTQLFHSGKLDEVAGVILGDFDAGDDPDEDSILQEQLWQRVLELTESSSCPVWGNFPVGHRDRNLAVPLGVEMSMDSSELRLILHQTDTIQKQNDKNRENQRAEYRC